ncbi:MAG: NYN domain-containing protein [Planctomycetia bacterium]|nr:NYN domain-containing protein [Planctomycetia bacterium]
MKPSAVLLIDLENFYYSREDNVPGYDRHWFASDLEKLLGFAREMVEPLPFTVRRAYANFSVVRYPKGAPREFPLQVIPDTLLRQGVEPVQVFRLSSGTGGTGGRGSKNAADMRMAMDATSLLAGGGHIEHFVLVTGDADFIPVILELKCQGLSVSVIGVANATNELIQRFVDNFEQFEDLVAAEEVEAQSGQVALAGDGMMEIAAAVRKLLGRTRPLRFAAVKPLLSKELGRPFDPGTFGCDTTGDFLRKYQSQLGVEIRVQPHDLELDLPNGNGLKSVSRPTTRPAERLSLLDRQAEQLPIVEPHSSAHYHQLLASGGPMDSPVGTVKVAVVPWSALVWSCDATVAELAPPTGGPSTSPQLLARLLKAVEETTIPDLEKHLRRVYPTLRAALPSPGVDSLLALSTESQTGERFRSEVLRYIVRVLNCRLAEASVEDSIQPESLARLFDPGSALDQAEREFSTALTETPAVCSCVPLPGMENIHTSSGYLKLLKAGGAKGSETEALKILPAPWPSVERVCVDVFAALAPAAGGAPMPHDQLYTRLVEAGEELCIEHYDQHARRALGILRVAGELTEENGLVSLKADLPSAQELRNRGLAFLLDLLRYRLQEREIFDPIDPQTFVTALEAGPLTDVLLEEVTPAIAWLYRSDQSELTDIEPIPEPALELPADDSCPASTVTQQFTELPDTEEPLPLEELEESALESDLGPDEGRPYSLDDLPPSSVESPSAVADDDSEEVTFQKPVEDTIGDESPSVGDPRRDTSGVLDVAVITREAIAAGNEDSPILSLGRTAEPAALELAARESERLAVPESPTAPVANDEAPPVAVPVGDWLPETESDEPADLKPTPPTTPPSTVNDHPERNRAYLPAVIDKMSSHAKQPTTPVPPPLPPESA